MVIDAAKKNNVKKYILITDKYITRPYSLMNIFRDFTGIKLKTENLLRTSGLNYTIVRPGGFKNNKNISLKDFDLINENPLIQ